MDDCCLRSFVDKGIREHFRLGDPGEQHRCPTCGQVFELQRAPAGDTPTYEHYEWKAVTH
jgi:hypothetical protein